jgi:hypothetical protein
MLSEVTWVTRSGTEVFGAIFTAVGHDFVAPPQRLLGIARRLHPLLGGPNGTQKQFLALGPAGAAFDRLSYFLYGKKNVLLRVVLVAQTGSGKLGSLRQVGVAGMRMR